MNHLLVKELIETAHSNNKSVTIRAMKGIYRIYPDTPVEYYMGALHFENIYVNIEHIVSIKTNGARTDEF